MFVLPAVTLLLATAMLAASGAAAPARSGPPAVSPAARGLAFARAHCSACHAIDAGISPKPQAPSFAGLVNAPGLNADTLQPWLRNAHDFPEIMNFSIAPGEIDALAAYMLTLKDPGYRPPIQ